MVDAVLVVRTRPTLAQLADSDRFEREADIVFSLKTPTPKWMTTFDKPWEYLTPRLALDMRTGGKR